MVPVPPRTLWKAERVSLAPVSSGCPVRTPLLMMQMAVIMQITMVSMNTSKSP